MDHLARSAIQQIDPALFNGTFPQPAPPARMLAGAPQQRASAASQLQQQQQQALQAPQQRVKMTPSEDRQVVVNYKEFMQMQNQFAHNLSVFSGIATQQFYAASNNLQAIQAAMGQVQNNVKSAFASNQINIDDVDFGSYTALHDLVNNNDLLSNPLMGFANQRGAGLPQMLQGLAPKKQRKQRKPKDPTAPKRPITAFFLFSREERERIREELKRKKGSPDVKPGEVQKEIQDQWNAMDDKGQQKWKDMYLKEMHVYRLAVDQWKKSGAGGAPPAPPGVEEAEEDGEGEEEDDDDDDDDEAEGEEESSSEESEEEVVREPTPPPVKKGKKSKKATPAPEPVKSSKKHKSESPEEPRKRKAESPAVESHKKKKKSEKKKDTGEYGDDY